VFPLAANAQLSQGQREASSSPVAYSSISSAVAVYVRSNAMMFWLKTAERGVFAWKTLEMMGSEPLNIKG